MTSRATDPTSWPWLAAMALIPVLAAGCLVQDPLRTPLGDSARLLSVEGPGVVTVPGLGERGAHLVHYEHGAEARLNFAVTAQPGMPLVVSGARLEVPEVSLAVNLDATVDGTPLPGRVGGGRSAVLELRAHLENCQFYEEPETQTISSLLVDVTNAGRAQTWRLRIDPGLAIRSPMIVACPGRTLDQSYDVRPAHGPVAG